MKLNKKLLLLIPATAGLFLSGCATAVIGGAAAAVGTGVAVATDNRGGDGVVSDQQLSDRAKDLASSLVPSGSYTFSAYNGKILMAGQVPSAADRAKVVSGVQNMNGITGTWDYLTVGHNQSFGQVTKDTTITTEVKSQLIGTSGLNANNIKVVTCNGVVYLMGSDVGSRSILKSVIEDSISRDSGVKLVVNLVR